MKKSGKSKSPSQLIDARIRELDDWRGQMLSRLRSLVLPFGITVTYLDRSGRGSKPFVFDFAKESSQIFASESPLKRRRRWLGVTEHPLLAENVEEKAARSER